MRGGAGRAPDGPEMGSAHEGPETGRSGLAGGPGGCRGWTDARWGILEGSKIKIFVISRDPVTPRCLCGVHRSSVYGR